MANKFAIANGNFNDASIWSLSATGLSATTVPDINDVVFANSYVVAITGDAACRSFVNGVSAGSVAGGYFLIQSATNSISLTGHVGFPVTSPSVNVMVLSGSQNISLSGDIYGGHGLSNAANTAIGVNSFCTNNTVNLYSNFFTCTPSTNNISGGINYAFLIQPVSNSVYNINGSVLQPTARNSQYGVAQTFRNLGPCTINFNGDIQSAGGNIGGDISFFSQNGTVNHTGNIIGSSVINLIMNAVVIAGGNYNINIPILFSATAGQNGGTTPLISNTGGIVNITAGSIVGGSTGNTYSFNGVGASGGTTNIIAGSISSGSHSAAITQNGGIIRITAGNILSNTANIAAINSTAGTLLISGNILNASNGTQAIYAPSYRIDPVPTNGVIRHARNGTGVGSDAYLYQYTTDSLSAFSMPPISSVRAGVTFANSTLTGTCNVPSPSSVSFGTLVDNTSGTAVVSVNDLFQIFTTPLSSLTTPNTIGSRIRTAATTEATGNLIASFTNG